MKIRISRLPGSLAEFSAMPQMDLSVPQNTCVLFLCALNLYIKDRDAGIEALNLLRGPRPLSPYDIQFLRDRLREKSYLPLAYFDGANPGNNYTPSEPLVLEVLEDSSSRPQQPGYLRLFLRTAGADSPRPLTLRRKGDTWCLWEYSSILSGIRIPAAQDPWA